MAQEAEENTDPTDIITKVDKALEEYYQKLGKEYKNNAGERIFVTYCDNNGFDDDGFLEELNEDVGETTILGCWFKEDGDDDGDDDEDVVEFPFEKDIDDDNAKKVKVFEMLKEMAGVNNNEQENQQQEKPKPTPFDLDQSIDLNDEEVKETTEKYVKQMPSLGSGFKDDKGMQRCFAIGKRAGIPFLTYMIDSFTKDRAKQWEKNGNQIVIREWVEKNKIMGELKKKNHKQIVQEIETAMSSYSGRIMSRLQLIPTVKINDDLKEISQYVVCITTFIKKLIEQEKASPPFQVDLIVAVRKVTSEVTQDEGSDDDDTDDDEEEIKTDDNGGKDLIGNVQNSLRDVKVSYFPKNKWGLDDGKTPDGIARNLMQNYRGLRNLSETKDTYPQNGRFCIFLDRREKKPTKNGDENEDDDEIDEMTFFEPSGSSKTIPNDHVPEIGFELLRKCMIPRNGKDNNIVATDNLGGQLVTFMFNVEQVDEIKCYIIWNGQTMRFHGEHLIQVLPSLFKETNENTAFVKDKDGESKKLMDEFNSNIVDRRFDTFNNAMSQK